MYRRLTKEGRAAQKILLIAGGIILVFGYILVSIAAELKSAPVRPRYVAPTPPINTPPASFQQYHPPPTLPRGYKTEAEIAAEREELRIQKEAAEKRRQLELQQQVDEAASKRRLREDQARNERQAAMDARIQEVREEMLSQDRPWRTIESNLPPQQWTPAPAPPRVGNGFQAEQNRVADEQKDADRVRAENDKRIAAQRAENDRRIAAKHAEDIRQQQRLDRVRQSLRQTPPQTTRPSSGN